MDTQRRGAKEALSAPRRWGVLLAGGDGVRLRKLTRFVCGDNRPKQFCRILSERTLLEEARQRAERSIDPDQVLYSVTRDHYPYYVRDLGDRASQRIVQPCNKGTAPAILYTLLHILQADRDAMVAVLPCDHYYSQESVFAAALESAFATAEALPQSVVLLGAHPKGPEIEYGWIEVGESVPGSHADVFQVTKFHEKPERPVAEHLLRSGCLWNTFVMVGHINAFLEMAARSVPALLETLRSAHILPPSSSGETRILDRLYDQIEPTDFSRQVLTPEARRLVTLRLGTAGWNDLGDPERVMSVLLERNELPSWAMRWQAERHAELGTGQFVSLALA